MNNLCCNCFGMDKPPYCAIKDLYTDLDDCPCMNCLVKVMCSEVCKERKKYYALKLNDDIKT